MNTGELADSPSVRSLCRAVVWQNMRRILSYSWSPYIYIFKDLFLKVFIYLFILAALGLSCGTQDLPCGMRAHSCDMWAS